MEQGHRPFGIVEELLVSRSRTFADDTVLRLGKIMVISGDNATGKTFLFRLLDTLSYERRTKLGGIFRADEFLSYSIRLRNPAPHEIKVEGRGSDITVSLNGAVVPFIPITVEVFFQESKLGFRGLENYLKMKRAECGDALDTLDDLLILSEYWQMDTELVRKLVSKAGTFVEHAFNQARFVDNNGASRLLVNDKRWRPDAPIHKISGGMLEMLSLDVTIAYAMLMSEQVPTLLLLNLPILHLDHTHLSLYVNFMHSPDVKFQTLIATPDPKWADPGLPWEVVQLRKDHGKSILEQLT